MDKLSALIDGEASRGETRTTMRQLKASGECCDAWETFHLIGDVMRGDHTALPADFQARFHACMEQEPTVIARHMAWRKTTHLALSAAASCAAVAVILTLVLTDNPLQPQPQIAAIPKAELIQVAQPLAPEPVPIASQARINEYLMAHQEYSPSTAFQGVLPYVRTVAATGGNQ